MDRLPSLSSAAVGSIATVYLVGEVAGALLFDRLSDALGQRKPFMVTLGVYLIGAGAYAQGSLLVPTAVGVIQVYSGTIPYIRAVRGNHLPTAVVSSANTKVNGADIAVQDFADLLDGTGQPDRSAR